MDPVSSLNLRLPDYLHNHIRELAKREGVSINQLITLAVAEKVSALDAASYLQERANRADADAYREVLEAVPDVPADAHDAIPEDLQGLFRKP